MSIISSVKKEERFLIAHIASDGCIIVQRCHSLEVIARVHPEKDISTYVQLIPYTFEANVRLGLRPLLTHVLRAWIPGDARMRRICGTLEIWEQNGTVVPAWILKDGKGIWSPSLEISVSEARICALYKFMAGDFKDPYHLLTLYKDLEIIP